MSTSDSQDEHRAPRIGEVPGHPETSTEILMFAAFDAALVAGFEGAEVLRRATGTAFAAGPRPHRLRPRVLRRIADCSRLATEVAQ